MDAETKRRVRERAEHCCEYCTIHQSQEPYHRFHVEHITPRQHGGADDLENLALACYYCNAHKGTNLTSIDPHDQSVVMLYHPRRDQWSDHFVHVGAEIIGGTFKGRATVRLLAMNDEYRLELRSRVRFNTLDG